MKYVEENSRIWDKRAENNDRWSTAGFVIAGFYEDRGCWLFDNYINTSMAKCSRKSVITSIKNTGIKVLQRKQLVSPAKAKNLTMKILKTQWNV